MSTTLSPLEGTGMGHTDLPLEGIFTLLSPPPFSILVFLVLCFLAGLASLFVLLVLPRIVSRVLSIFVGCDISVGKIKLWGSPSVENVSVSVKGGGIEIYVDKVSIKRNDFTANSYFTLKAERAKITRRSDASSEAFLDGSSSPRPPGSSSPQQPNYELIVSKLLALLAVVSFVIEELIVELDILDNMSGGNGSNNGGRRKLFSVTRLGEFVLFSPSMSLPPPLAMSPSQQPQPEVLSSPPQPSAKCLIKNLRQTFCLVDGSTTTAQSTPDVDFTLPNTTHVDASVRDGIKIELSEGGFVAFNSLEILSTLAQELSERKKNKSDSGSGGRKINLTLPTIKVVSTAFFVRTVSAEMKLSALIAWYHSEHDATVSIRSIDSHCLATGEQVFSARTIKAEKLQDCAEFTYEDLTGHLNGVVIALFGKMEPYHESLDFELRIASGSARKRYEGTEISLLQTRLYGLGDREIFSTEAASMESAESLRFAHCVVRQCAFRPGQRDIELLLLSVLHVADKSKLYQRRFLQQSSLSSNSEKIMSTADTDLALAVDVDNLVFDLPWKRGMNKLSNPVAATTGVQFGLNKATLEFKNAKNFSLVVKRWQAATVETCEQLTTQARSRTIIQCFKSILFVRHDDSVKLLTKGQMHLSWYPFVHKVFYDCAQFFKNLGRKYMPPTRGVSPPAMPSLRSVNVAMSEAVRLDMYMQKYTMRWMTRWKI
jgi:hypothetical protein